ncbi:MAG: inositol monophosphatase family protein [Alphaproteobacteria bacterium]|jgi:myo-inositol-1(or 4)-monophosphatase|nr:inositol monophosphatase family protein [Alphaproteobacteria bacterium]
MAQRSPVVNVIAGAVVKAARALNRDFGEIESLQSSPKGPGKFAAKALSRAEDGLMRELTRARRDYRVIRADDPLGDPGEPAWLVAPIVGLRNFGRGLPWFASVVGVREEGRILAGAIYDPLRDVLNWAEHGIGAYANHQRIRVSAHSAIADALVALAPAPGDAAGHAAALRALAGTGAVTRETGCAALDMAAVASGRFDGFWGAGVAPVVAEIGGLMVREAGGLVEADTAASGAIVAGNGYLGRDLATALSRAGPLSSAP